MLQSHFYTSQKFFLRYIFEVLFFTGSRKKCKKRNKVAAGIRQPWCKNKNEKSWRRSMACSVMLSQGSSMESRCGVVTKQQGGAHLLVPNPVKTATRTSLWHFTVDPSLKPQLLRDTAMQLSPLESFDITTPDIWQAPLFQLHHLSDPPSRHQNWDVQWALRDSAHTSTVRRPLGCWKCALFGTPPKIKQVELPQPRNSTRCNSNPSFFHYTDVMLIL